MDYEKMTEAVLRRRDEIRRQKKKDAIRLVAAMSVTWVIGSFIGTGIYTAFLKKDVTVPPMTESITVSGDPADTGEADENIILSHEPLGDFGFLGLPEGYTSSWDVDESKLGGKKTVNFGNESVKLYYNYSVDVFAE